MYISFYPANVTKNKISTLTNLNSHSFFFYRNKKEGYEEFEMPAKNKNLMNVQPTLVLQGKQFSTDVKLDDLDELPEPERPPLRQIDQYIKAECPCLSQRYTVAVLTCLGFVISFGMRCNMGMAKLQFEHYVSTTKSFQ